MTTAAPAGAGVLERVDDAGGRGRLYVADRVIEKIAARAATEVEHTGDPDRRLADRLPGRHSPATHAEAIISGRLVQLRVQVAISYPVSLVQVTRAVRAHVRDVVGRLCDVEVREVDVVVTRLRRAAEQRRVQ